ncbi:MAG: hypothetical protein WKF31_12285 [Thermoleophilaceae bacterium]
MGASSVTRTRRRSAPGAGRARPQRGERGRGPVRAAGGRPGRIRWDRVGRVALLVVLVAILLLYIAPVSHWMTQSRTAGDYRAEVHRLVVERERLRGRIATLGRPDGLEREARKLGMVRRGERAWVIEGLPRR